MTTTHARTRPRLSRPALVQRAFLIASALGVLAWTPGCGTKAEPQTVSGGSASEARNPSQPAPRTDNSPSGIPSKVKFKGAEGFSIKPMADGAKLVDGSENEIARYTVREGLRIKVKDAGDKFLGQIKGAATKLHIENSSGKREFALQKQADGDYKFERADESLISKIKKKDYGWKIENAKGQETGKVKDKGGKISLTDAQGETKLYTKEALSTLAVACLALEELELPMRVALAIRIQAGGN